MQGSDITNRLKEVLPKYTDEFSDIIDVTSLTRSGTTITAVTASAHSLTTGDYMTIRGALDPVTITSLDRIDNVVTVVTTTKHKLSDPSLYAPSQLPILVTISGADPAEYNGTFKLLTVTDENTFTYEITTTPATPATTAGFLLQEDFDGYNGYKQVTVTNTTTFTYETTNTNLNTPAQGTIEMSNATRIAWAATAERADQFYSEDVNRVTQNWMFVVLNDKPIFRDDITATDPSAAQNRNESFFYESQQDFSILTFLPTQGETLAGSSSDKARTFERPILKSIANFPFSSPLTESVYQPAVYGGNGTEDYNTAYYVHRFDFLAKGYIQIADVSDVNPGVPLDLVDGTIKDTEGMIFKPRFRC